MTVRPLQNAQPNITKNYSITKKSRMITILKNIDIVPLYGTML
jgi:hypothetical protein